MKATRRDALKTIGVAGAGFVFSARTLGQTAGIRVGGKPVEIAIEAAPTWTGTPSERIVRITVRPIVDGQAVPVADHRILNAASDAVRPARRQAPLATAAIGRHTIAFSNQPPTLAVAGPSGAVVQRLVFDPESTAMRFTLPKGPLLGFGEGGAGFDRKGTIDPMRNGQATYREPSGKGGYALRTHGARVAIPWLIGSDGWAIYVHQPAGTFDLSGADGLFTPRTADAPIDVFVVTASTPAEIMRAWAELTGPAEIPPLWSLGYLQSHRTLSGPDEIMSVARTFREKQLPCDALIYLGTDFTPSGWNTHNGEFSWNPKNFPEPTRMIDALHDLHYKVVLHIVVEGRVFSGTVNDACTAAPIPPGRTEDNRWPPERQVACYWPAHKPLYDLGIDGWWPDQGDGFDQPSRLARIRMYWDGSQQWRPNERPFALHRNGQAGMQRYGAFLWSGDVYTTWETLKLHVPIAINTALSGIPYWGTDIGGFVPTSEYTGELHVRWFQFGAFNTLFRAHGRNWHLRLPWGWNLGTVGTIETANSVGASTPPEHELRNPDVEPICKKYLELRYRLMPYLYSAVRECSQTGMPIVRALWLHYADDPVAVARGDQFLWGRDILVAPVVEKGATTRRVYLPRGRWIDFWTNEGLDGGREIDRPVDLATMPLYARAGAILPMGPVKQYTSQAGDGPLTLQIYPGADGAAQMYEDDGASFDYRKGAWMGLAMRWQDRMQRLTLALEPGSRMIGAARREIEVRIAGSTTTRRVTFEGREVSVEIPR
ncbi:MAG TPA: TIM-barrel domain-containing protein [Vicinamibacterales bacterium]|nr:TIM-barrel domain-containing protein [Vicinamibacterales bacterium]